MDSSFAILSLRKSDAGPAYRDRGDRSLARVPLRALQPLSQQILEVVAGLVPMQRHDAATERMLNAVVADRLK